MSSFKTKKVLINDCYGFFNISPKAARLYNEYKGESLLEIEINHITGNECVIEARKVKRDDPMIIRVVEELNEEAYVDTDKRLKMIEVRDEEGWSYRIREYDGCEWIEEQYTSIPVELIIYEEERYVIRNIKYESEPFQISYNEGHMLEVPLDKQKQEELLKLYSIVRIHFDH